jgi:hypothetical protein
MVLYILSLYRIINQTLFHIQTARLFSVAIDATAFY